MDGRENERSSRREGSCEGGAVRPEKATYSASEEQAGTRSEGAKRRPQRERLFDMREKGSAIGFQNQIANSL